jgi:tRNA(Ile2) C34 agmatinyltransferase TiaS
MSKPKCPVCGRKGTPLGELFRCPLGHLFDSDPDEGGSFDDRDPSRRLEREEEMRLARRHNAEGRGRAQQGFRFGGRR